MVILDEEGNVLLPHRGPRTAEAFLNSVRDAQSYLAFKKAGAAGDAEAGIEVVLLEMKYRRITRSEGEAALARLGTLSEGQTQRAERIASEMRAEELCEQAGTKVKADDLAGAIADLTRATELDPKSTAAFGGRANARRRYGDLDGAIADYTRTIEMDPANAWWYCARGNTRCDAGAAAAALADYRKACELDPEGQAYARLGIWLLRAAAGEREAATEELRTFMADGANSSAEAWSSNLASLLLGDLPVADLLERAAAGSESGIQGRLCDAYFYAGALMLIEGDKATAKEYFEKCVATGVKEYSEYASAMASLRALSAGQ